MTRIHVTEPDTDSDNFIPGVPDPEQPQRRAGYFASEKAQVWTSKTEWDGNNRVDVNTRDYTCSQYLYRTAQGRWVLNVVSKWQGVPETYHYIADTAARDWLLFNDHDTDLYKYFGEPEEERGPGRPEIGGAALIRFGDQLAVLDDWAKAHGVTRAEAAREAVRHLAQ
jgi:hypothetical protein